MSYRVIWIGCIWNKATGEEQPPNTLDRLSAGQGYLVYATNVYYLTVTGKCECVHYDWQAQNYLLTGFESADEGTTFRDWFGPYIDAVEAIYYLQYGTNIKWHLQDLDGKIKRDHAYFVELNEVPLMDGALETSEGVFLSSVDDTAIFTLKNNLDFALTVKVTYEASAEAPAGYDRVVGKIPLRKWNGTEWVTAAYTNEVNYLLTPDFDLNWVFSVDRDALSGSLGTNEYYAGLLKLTATNHNALHEASFELTRLVVYRPAQDTGAQVWPYGLWVGEATLMKVSYNKGGDDPQMVSDPMSLRLLMHCDMNKRIRLLSQAICALTTNEQGSAMYRVFADLDAYERAMGVGAELDEDKLYRISSPAFGLMPPLLMDGTFFDEGQGIFTVAWDDPLNPYYHAFNRNLNNTEGTNTFDIVNTVKLVWTSGDDAPLASASVWNPAGDCVGTYEHRIAGLQTNDIRMSGDFRMSWISGTATLEE